MTARSQALDMLRSVARKDEGGRIVHQFATDPGRLERMGIEAAGLSLDLSKQSWSAEGFEAALDLARDGITVNAICPGPTETAMTAGIRTLPAVHDALARAVPMQRWGAADEVAAVIEFFVSEAASFVTGAVIPVDGGVTASTGQFAPTSRSERR